MDAQILCKLYSLNMDVIERNVEGIRAEEGFLQPEPAGNCINWVLGHIVATRNLIMELLGNAPVWAEQESAQYDRGSPPLSDRQTAIPLERMLADLRASQEKLVTTLQQMSSEELAAPSESGTKLDQLAFLQFHEAYHAGQLGLLRRLTGKPGAIA
jgi:uncharacterized damage-inducible protein DinB